MYAKIPFNAGWSNVNLISVIHALINGVTNPASLPAGVTANASITSTVPPGWNISSFVSNVLICHAPITNRLTKRKYVKIEVGPSAVDMSVGDSLVSTNLYLNGVSVNKTVRLCDYSNISNSVPVMLHVSVTKERILTCLEKLSNANPVTSLNTNHNVGGVTDAVYVDGHYNSGGKLIPITLLETMETDNVSLAPAMLPLTFASTPTVFPALLSFQKAQFVMAGRSSSICVVPAQGRTNPSGASSTQQNVFQLGVSASVSDPVSGVFPDLLAAVSTAVPAFQEHTRSSKTYVAWSVGTANTGTPTTLLVPKE